MIWTRAPAFGLKPSTGRFAAFGGPALTHQGARQSKCRNSDTVHMAATDQMPDPNKALAPREPSTHGPRAAPNAAPVLDPGRGRTSCRRRVFDTTTGYLWALARDDRRWGGADPPGVVVFYAPGRGGQNAETVLRGFDGTLQLDGYQGCNRLTRPSRKGGAPIGVAHCRVDGVVAGPRPSQIRTCRFPASGSSRTRFAQVRLH